MLECLFRDNVGINGELRFKLQGSTNPFDRFSKGFILPSNSVIRTSSVRSINVAVLVSVPFASCQSGDRTENSKI